MRRAAAPSLSIFAGHGGRLDAAVEAFPQAPLPWIDLSTGLNPVPYPTAAIAPADARALPTRAALAELEGAAADAFGFAAGAIAAVPGSEIGLRLLATLGLPGPAFAVRPGYGSHAEALPDAVGVAFDALDGALGAARTVLLANPNNPDGRLVLPAQLLALARSLAERDGWLVVDEAFADAHGGASILPLIGERDRVLVLRSFGKFYGLAGLRLGFACGAPDLVERLRARLGDWPVASQAIEIGTAAYRDTGWREATRERLRLSAAALDALLGRHRLAAGGECPLFRLVRTPDAAALFERLARRGILTRPFADRPDWLRIGLPANAAEFERLDEALGDG